MLLLESSGGVPAADVKSSSDGCGTLRCRGAISSVYATNYSLCVNKQQAQPLPLCDDCFRVLDRSQIAVSQSSLCFSLFFHSLRHRTNYFFLHPKSMSRESASASSIIIGSFYVTPSGTRSSKCHDTLLLGESLKRLRIHDRFLYS